MKKKISVSWSGGKDSAFALYKILKHEGYDVVQLHTVLNAETKRVGMHGVHESLIDQQALALNLPLEKLFLPASESHDAYTKLIGDYYMKCRANGIESILFGDIFLEDLKKFRDSLLGESGLTGIYPLWKSDSRELIEDFIQTGFKTLICSANANLLSRDVMGRTIDLPFIQALPEGVDPCGENGEFHTFVYDAPIFNHAISIHSRNVVSREYSFKYTDDNGNLVETKTPFWFLELTIS